MTFRICPRCASPAPEKHPATQADGGEVFLCPHPFHNVTQEAYDNEVRLLNPKETEGLHAMHAHPGWEYRVEMSEEELANAEEEGWEHNTPTPRYPDSWRRRRPAPVQEPLKHKHGQHDWHWHVNYEGHQLPIDDEQVAPAPEVHIQEALFVLKDGSKVTQDFMDTNIQPQQRMDRFLEHMAGLTEINAAQATLIADGFSLRETQSIKLAKALAQVAELKSNLKHMEDQSAKLANFIMAEFPFAPGSGPDPADEGAVDTAIRLLRIAKEMAETVTNLMPKVWGPIYEILKSNGVIR